MGLVQIHNPQAHEVDPRAKFPMFINLEIERTSFLPLADLEGHCEVVVP